jgi:hypothetical protein
MKLITELNEQVAYIEESLNEGSSKALYIEGIFMQGGIKNRNGRVYPVGILEKEVSRYVTEKVNSNRAYGELGHPSGPTINLDRASHIIKELRQDGSNFIGKAKIMESLPMGKIVKGLIQEGAGIAVSSRGLGTLKPNREGIMEVQNDFMLATAGDIVADPSAPSAFVRGIMEGAEWVYDVATGDWRLEKLCENTRKLNTRKLQESQIAIFEKFMSRLASL